jgi:hypothetical protein
MDDFNPIFSHHNAEQVDDPQISLANGDHQIAQSLWVRQMTFMKEEPIDSSTNSSG